MSDGRVSWVEIRVNQDWRTGGVSWASFSVGGDPLVGTDSGVGIDTAVRTTGSGIPKAGTDSGLGQDTGNALVAGSTIQKFSSDSGFGFSRYAAAGLVFLFRDGEVPAFPGTTSASRSALDSGVGTSVATVLQQDRGLFPTDEGIGADTSRRNPRFDSGSGIDSSIVTPGGSSLPEVVLEVAFDTDPTDEVQIYTVVSDDSSGAQIEFTTKRGRQDELKEPQTGTLITALFNQARQFDPAYTASPYFPEVLPVKSARLSAKMGNQTYYLMVGDIEQWPQQLEGRMNRATVQANDGFDPLSQVQVEITRPEETTGARINAILDAAQWPVSQREIDTGQTVLHSNTYSGSALELIRSVVADEDGYFFMKGSGVARFIERHSRFKPPYTTPQVTLSTRPVGFKLPLASADYQVDKDFIKNQVIVNVEAIVDSEGNTLQEEKKFVEEDAVSMGHYRPRALTYDRSAISDLNEAATKAQYHLDRLKDPVVRVKSVVIEPQQDSNLWAHVLGREIGDRIAVEIYPVQVGTEEVVYFEGIIEYVEHRYVVGKWQTVWYLSPADRNNYWILDDPVLGVLGTTTRLGY